MFSLLTCSANMSAQPCHVRNLTGPYLGQTPPAMKPQVFAAGLTSPDLANGGFAFSRNGEEVFFFSVDRKGRYSLQHSLLRKDCWLEPRAIFRTSSANDTHPFFSTDGKTIFFGSDRRIEQGTKVPYYNLWKSERTADTWNEPTPLPSTIDTGFEDCVYMSKVGTLYFRRVSPDTRGDIFTSGYVDGEPAAPTKLPDTVNTAYDESHPAVAPDESYLIFSSKRPGGFNGGRDELWISVRNTDGTWSPAVNMGRVINDGNSASCATISPDGEFLFFVRIENGRGVPYWVSASIIDTVVPRR